LGGKYDGGVCADGRPGEQGVSPHWGESYLFLTEGQWIDVTDTAPGPYVLEVEMNGGRLFQESNYSNNRAAVDVVIVDEPNANPLPRWDPVDDVHRCDVTSASPRCQIPCRDTDDALVKARSLPGVMGAGIAFKCQLKSAACVNPLGTACSRFAGGGGVYGGFGATTFSTTTVGDASMHTGECLLAMGDHGYCEWGNAVLVASHAAQDDL
jgi:hypothetical protein